MILLSEGGVLGAAQQFSQFATLGIHRLCESLFCPGGDATYLCHGLNHGAHYGQLYGRLFLLYCGYFPLPRTLTKFFFTHIDDISLLFSAAKIRKKNDIATYFLHKYHPTRYSVAF